MVQRFASSFPSKPPQFAGPSFVMSLGLVLGFGLIVSGIGCGGALGGECILDSDCQEKLICAYQFCHVPCNKTKDCNVAAGEECMIGHEDNKASYNYCAIPKQCSRNIECGDDRVCANGICRDACTSNQYCLEDEICIGGFCLGPSDPPPADGEPLADLDSPCLNSSECKSNNCKENLCVGCAQDVDCVGGRTCDPMAFDITGKCLSDSVSSRDEFDATVALIDIGDILVRNAVPDSEGNIIYFLGHDPNNNQDAVFRRDPDGGICPIFFADNLGSVIAISSDDKQLIISGFDPGLATSQLWLLDIAQSGCTKSISQPILWSDGFSVAWLDILPDPNGDTYYFVADPGFAGGAGLYIGASNSATLLNSDWTTLAPSRTSIGLSRKLFLTTEKQLTEINLNGSTTTLAAHVDLGETIPFEGGHMALNRAENTLYVPVDSETQHRVIRVNVDNPSQTQRYALDGAVNTGTLLGGSLRRARKRNVFAWISSEGKLYRFEPQ